MPEATVQRYARLALRSLGQDPDARVTIEGDPPPQGGLSEEVERELRALHAAQARG